MGIEEEFSNTLVLEMRDGGDGDFDTTRDTLHDIRGEMGAMTVLLEVMGYAGTVYYVSQDDGTDGATVAGTKSAPFATIDYAWSRVSANAGDVIVVMPSTSVYDENTQAVGIAADVAKTAMVCGGRGMVELDNSNAANTSILEVSADSILVSGFYFASGRTLDPIIISSDFNIVQDCWIHTAISPQNGITINGGSRNEVKWNSIEGLAADGIEVTGVSVGNVIEHNRISGVAGNGIHLNGDGVDSNYVRYNSIHRPGSTVGMVITLGDNNQMHYNDVAATTEYTDSGTNNSWLSIADGDALKKKPEWGTPTAASVTPAADSTWIAAFTLAVTNPGLLALQIDITVLQALETGRIRIAQKVDGTNWKVIGNAEYDDTDFSLIDDIAPAPSATDPLEARPWTLYIDSACDIRLEVWQAGGVMRALEYRYNIKDEV